MDGAEKVPWNQRTPSQKMDAMRFIRRKARELRRAATLTAELTHRLQASGMAPDAALAHLFDASLHFDRAAGEAEVWDRRLRGREPGLAGEATREES